MLKPSRRFADRRSTTRQRSPAQSSTTCTRNAVARKTHAERDPDGEPSCAHNRELALLSRTLFALALTPRVPDGSSVGSGLRPESWLQGQQKTTLHLISVFRYELSIQGGCVGPREASLPFEADPLRPTGETSRRRVEHLWSSTGATNDNQRQSDRPSARFVRGSRVRRDPGGARRGSVGLAAFRLAYAAANGSTAGAVTAPLWQLGLLVPVAGIAAALAAVVPARWAAGLGVTDALCYG